MGNLNFILAPLGILFSAFQAYGTLGFTQVQEARTNKNA
jgi:hypothetical protein